LLKDGVFAESAKRSGREEVSVAQSLLQLPVAAAEEPRAVEPPAKKSKKSGAAAKDSRKVYLEEHVQTLVATNRELVQGGKREEMRNEK
jgi:hypothetical protein